MKKITKVLTSNRFKSFYWRTGMMALAGFLNLIIESLSDFGMSGQSVVITGLILGEISKALNKQAK